MTTASSKTETKEVLIPSWRKAGSTGIRKVEEEASSDEELMGSGADHEASDPRFATAGPPRRLQHNKKMDREDSCTNVMGGRGRFASTTNPPVSISIPAPSASRKVHFTNYGNGMVNKLMNDKSTELRDMRQAMQFIGAFDPYNDPE
jgi:hypothetical protein